MRRKHRRWPIVLGVLLCAFGLLLLLTALIETPADEAAPVTDSHAAVGAQLLPAVLPSPETAPMARETGETFLPFALFLSLALALPRLVRGSDANGRILRKKRYARSYHPVFRQELACG